MATKTAAREVEIVAINPDARFGMDRPIYGKIVTVVGIDHMEGIHIAQVGRGYREICDTCTGTGFRPYYAGILAGRCFYCGGTGLRALIGTGTADELIKVLVRRAKARARAAAKREAKFAAAKVAHAAWIAANPAIAEIAARFGSLTDCRCERIAADRWRECNEESCWERQREVRNTHDGVLLELAGYATCRIITDKQVDLLVKLTAEHEVRAAAHAVKTAKVAERKHLGAVGEKVAVTGTLAKPWWSEGDCGTSTLYKLTTANGDVVTWFRTGFHQFEAGAAVTLTGTVKKLRETKEYGKETQLTRCKVS